LEKEGVDFPRGENVTLDLYLVLIIIVRNSIMTAHAQGNLRLPTRIATLDA
jgi:hypothetical protein